MRVRHIVICGLPGSNIYIYIHITSLTAQFGGGELLNIFSTNFVWNISHSKKNSASYDKKNCILVVTWHARYSWQIEMKLEFSGQLFEK